jgi:Protein of unknown function (DUF3300)
MRRGIRNILTRCLPIGLVLMLAAPPPPRAHGSEADAPLFKPGQLEQIVAPIALYPDALVAHIMMASTYPLEVIQAARLMKANPSLRDAALDEELQKYDWDDSVKALVRFPQVLEMMDSQLEWMQKLGDAVLAQQKDTMAAIQRLRARALRAGTLKSNEQQKVIVDGTPPQTIIRIEPVNPEIVYVPTYDPMITYGDWPYPAYPPYSYYPPYYPVGYDGITFGFGMLVGGAIWGTCNWRHGIIFVHVDHHNHFHRNVNRGVKVNPLVVDRGSGPRGRAVWQHNPEHRRGALGRDLAIQWKLDRAGGGATTASRGTVPGGNVGASTFPGNNVSASPIPGGNVGVSTFPGNNVGANRFPGNNVGVSLIPGNNVGGSTFPGNNVSASTFPGNTVGGSTFPGNNVGGSSFPGSNFSGNGFPGDSFNGSGFSRGGFSGGRMRGGGWGRR